MATSCATDALHALFTLHNYRRSTPPLNRKRGASPDATLEDAADGANVYRRMVTSTSTSSELKSA